MMACRGNRKKKHPNIVPVRGNRKQFSLISNFATREFVTGLLERKTRSKYSRSKCFGQLSPEKIDLRVLAIKMYK